MQPRLETLRRMVNLYALVEEMHAAELQRMTAAVRETQVAIAVEEEAAASARLEGRVALIADDRLGRVMAETQQDTSAWRTERLEQLRREREALNDAAREQYVASKLKREQIKRVMEDITERVDIEEQRRAQGTSDDRFLARRRWTDEQERIRADQQMKTC
jgi:hypothetical protein